MDPLLFGTISILVPNSSLSSSVLLTEFRSLPPLFEETPNAVHELTLARGIYMSMQLFLSVKIEDQDAFERDFFFMWPPSTISSGSLCRIELLNSTLNWNCFQPVLWANNCIKHAVELEQSFMEGAYNCVLSARQTVPHETYVYFMFCWQRQDEIAGCSKKAYDSLSINDARKILVFSSDKELFNMSKR
ncbi:unnamed protein product [Camellia sinensis]